MNFAQDPLRSYFDECQKNKIHLLYLHYLRNNFHQLKSSENEIIINNDLEVFCRFCWSTKKEQPLCRR